MGFSSAINSMFLPHEPGRGEEPNRALSPLQTHVLAQLAHAVALRAVASVRDDISLQRLVEKVIIVRYRDCVAQGVAQGARALIANIGRRQRDCFSR